jgi:hypothetical protein
MISGSLMNPRAKLSFCFMPVERLERRVSAFSARRVISRSSSARRPRLGTRHAVEPGEEVERLAHREDAVARGVAARDHVDPAADLEGLRGDVESRDACRSGGREEERGEDLDEGRLPRPVRTEEAEALAALHAEVDAVEGGGRRAPCGGRGNFA